MILFSRPEWQYVATPIRFIRPVMVYWPTTPYWNL